MMAMVTLVNLSTSGMTEKSKNTLAFAKSRSLNTRVSVRYGSQRVYMRERKLFFIHVVGHMTFIIPKAHFEAWKLNLVPRPFGNGFLSAFRFMAVVRLIGFTIKKSEANFSSLSFEHKLKEEKRKRGRRKKAKPTVPTSNPPGSQCAHKLTCFCFFFTLWEQDNLASELMFLYLTIWALLIDNGTRSSFIVVLVEVEWRKVSFLCQVHGTRKQLWTTISLLAVPTPTTQSPEKRP